MNDKEISLKLQEASLQLRLDRLATEQSLVAKYRELDEAKTTFPLDIKKIISLQVSIEGLEDGIHNIDLLAEELGLRDEDLAETTTIDFDSSDSPKPY